MTDSWAFVNGCTFLAGISDKAVPLFEQEAKGNNLNGYAAYASSQVVATSVPQMRGQIFEEAIKKGASKQQSAKAAAACPLRMMRRSL